MNAIHHHAAATDVRTTETRPMKKRVEVVVTVVSVVVIALLLAVDIVRTAPADASVVVATFDVAPAVEVAPPQAIPDARYARWSADDSAQGTRPDAVH